MTELEEAYERIRILNTLMDPLLVKNTRESLQCRTWLGSMIENSLIIEPDKWTYVEGREGSWSKLYLESGDVEVVVFYRCFWWWSLSVPSTRLPRHDRKILSKLVGQVFKSKIRQKDKLQEEREISRFVKSQEK